MKTTLKIALGSVAATLLLLTSEMAAAEQLEDDNYVVYYSAFNSTVITPEVAKAYELNRSRQRGLLNISVQRKMPDGKYKPVVAQLKGFTGQLGGSEIPLDFKLITEGDAVYYLAEFFIDEGDRLNFDVDIKPTPDYPTMQLDFDQTFFEN